VEEFLSSLGPVSAIIGAQWGDEGKGKATDILAEHFDVIARASGGANAGHTIVVEGNKHIFHLLPSGCFHEGKDIILGAGMVIHLPTLLEEIETLRGHGVDIVPRMHISSEAHILFDYHKKIDGAMEEERAKRSGEAIGTTLRGIGPAYMDKAARTGIRMERLSEDLTEPLRKRADDAKNKHGVEVDIEEEKKALSKAKEMFGDRVCDAVSKIHELKDSGKTILVEGAQGIQLDIDHGTYPFVTSSSTCMCGALQALGLPPQSLTSAIGVAKAYCTRVGGGVFASEADEEAGQRLRDRGGEYGATTGRPRRCGWLHLPDLVRGVKTNGFTMWNITKLDVLDEEESIPVGVGNEADGSIVYKELPGWKSPTVGMTSFEDLPEKAREFINFVEAETGVPVGLIGTGQGREQMIVKA